LVLIMKRSLLVSILGIVAVQDLAAQACAVGPGEVFGIAAYQCANCGFKREKLKRPTYTFFAEPVVLEAKSPGVFRIGDVIESVDGKPITTSAGADLFTYPALGDHEISVRRGRSRQVLRMSIAGTGCDVKSIPLNTTGFRFSLDDVERVEVLKGPAAAERYGATAPASGVVVITTKQGNAGPAAIANADSTRAQMRDVFRQAGLEPLIIVDGVPITSDERRQLNLPHIDRTGRFGFAVSCEPSCTAATTKEGTLHYTYYRYDGFPPIVAIRPSSPADRAGLKVGDLVTKVDGHSIRDEEGARILAKLDRVDAVRITVRRDGKDVEVELRADR
jgi:hypothetical protein